MAEKKFKALTYEDGPVSWTTFPDICKSCGICILKCPMKCLSYDGQNNEYLGMPAVKCDVKKCIACRTCVNACPDCAITVEGKRN